MPEISRFFGIVIAMFYNDHAPSHFHVRYGSERALIGIESLILLEGRLSPRALGGSSWNGRPATRPTCWKTGTWPGGMPP